ncbi:unnamed protein product [Cylindrotheca closterium]|uniref:PLC-like phosphodiesterase n=1 Tax=Cylindrotheca closterium TaxID=2856 RepID=A0AAD2CJC4_9STRA|nr:unnamed protein product [Cylindrotheca closterium]
MIFTKHQTILVLRLFITLYAPRVHGFHHSRCNQFQAQFQFPDCYVPDMDAYNLQLSDASFLMAHDAGTGYLSVKKGISSATNLYAKNQRGTVYEQLQNGARALDVRPKLLQNGTVALHHGTIAIGTTLETLVQDAIRWCNENPSELVLILHNNMGYDSNLSPDADTAVNALSDVYGPLGVSYVACGDVYGLTVAETMEISVLASGGYLLALDQQDAYTSFCGKSNYISDQLVTCYPNNGTLPCTNAKSPTHERLKEYALACSNNAATDSTYVLGPPQSLDIWPFNIIQGIWQVDTRSAATGVAHVSSLIDDNTKSRINAQLVDWIYDGEFNAVSLLAVDNVALNGNAILSVLRSKCGQSELGEEECGTAIRKPRLQRKPLSTLSFAVTLSFYIFFAIWVGVMLRHYRKFYRPEEQAKRLEKDLKGVEHHFKRVMAGEYA